MSCKPFIPFGKLTEFLLVSFFPFASIIEGKFFSDIVPFLSLDPGDLVVVDFTGDFTEFNFETKV